MIGPGTMLISVDGPVPARKKEDPVIGAFLSFLERDMNESPSRLKALSKTSTARARALTAETEVTETKILPATLACERQ